jgi:hypothetical protein
MGLFERQFPLESVPFVEQQSEPYVPVLRTPSGVHSLGFVGVLFLENRHQKINPTITVMSNSIVKNTSHENSNFLGTGTSGVVSAGRSIGMVKVTCAISTIHKDIFASC